MKRFVVLIAFIVIGFTTNAQFKTTVEAGYEVGTPSSDFEANRLVGNIIESYSAFNNHFQIGIGAGVQLFDDNTSTNNILVPVFLRLKGNILENKKVNPFVITDLGVTWFPEYDWEYIVFRSVFGAGIDIKVDTSVISFGINYVSQHYNTNYKMNAVSFVTGFTF